MSDGPRIPLEQATAAARWLMQRWGMHEDNGCAIVGSIRRGCATIGDIDLLAPLPAKDQPDELFYSIEVSLGLTSELGADLFKDPQPIRKPAITGKPIKGLKPDFKFCTLEVTGQSTLSVQIARYTPGAQGNRGWIELMRTGPAEFGEEVLVEWKRREGTAGTTKPGSEKGFLVDAKGRPLATPTELHAFHAAGLVMLKPDARAPGRLVGPYLLDSPSGSRARSDAAMRALGTNPEQVMRAWKDQTLALAGWKH